MNNNRWIITKLHKLKNTPKAYFVGPDNNWTTNANSAKIFYTHKEAEAIFALLVGNRTILQIEPL